MKYCTLLFFLFFSSLAHSQQEIFFIQYAKVFDVEATHDHNYSVVGWSGNVNGGNYFFSKLDSLGNEIWRHDNTAFNGTNFNNAMYRIHENTDHTFLLTGVITDTNLINQAYIVKRDSGGNILWEKRYSFSLHHSKAINTFEQNSNSTIFTGISDGLFVFKTDSLGDSLQFQRYNFPGYYPASDINQTVLPEGTGFIGTAAVVDSIHNNAAMLIYKVNFSLNLVWFKIITDTNDLFLTSCRIENYKSKFSIRKFGFGYAGSFRIELDSNGTILDSIPYPFDVYSGCFGNSKSFYRVAGLMTDTNCYYKTDSSFNTIWSICHANMGYDGVSSVYDEYSNAVIFWGDRYLSQGGGSTIYKIRDSLISTFVYPLDQEEISIRIQETITGKTLWIEGINQEATVELFDITGRILFQQKICSSSAIPLENCSGCCILRVKTKGKKEVVKKLIL